MTMMVRAEPVRKQTTFTATITARQATKNRRLRLSGRLNQTG